MDDTQMLWADLLRDVRQLIGDDLADYRPNLARATGVIPGRQLPTTGNTGSGYTPTAHATSHQSGGSDALDLGLLAGELTDAQHGQRAGGDLHAAATTSTPGFVQLAPNGGTTAGQAVQASDTRMSNARTPTAHASTHQNGGSDEIATATPGANAIPKAGSGGTLADGWLSAAIARLTDLTFANLTGTLSDAQHGSRSGGSLHAAATTSTAGFATLAASGGTTAGTVVQATDARLSDARTPTAHATSHQNGGSDEIATATPGANAIPKAGSGGTLADGWLSSAISRITSIALAAPAQFSVSGSPLTANGTLTLAWQNQSANQVLAGPSSGAAAAPGFRALVAADIPSLDSSKIGSGEMPRSPLTTRGDLLTQNPTGTHTRLAIGASGRYLRSDGTDPSWAQLDMADAAAGTLAAARGGTGLASYAVGDLLYASGATALSKLADVATGNALISGGVTTAPAWGKIGLTTHVSGILAGSNGGTGVDNGTNTLTVPASGTAALRASTATAGRLGFWSSATELSHDSVLFWDNTNKRLGLGTASPQRVLHVVGPDGSLPSFPSVGAKDLLIFENDANANMTFLAANTSQSAIKFGDQDAPQQGILLYDHSLDAMLLYTLNSERMRLTSAGSMLVGRTSGLTGAGDLDANGNVRGASFRVGLNQVVGARVTGWSLPTGTLSRATFDPSTATLLQVAQHLAAIITDLYSSHGMIGA